ncbi:MAG: replication protein RepA [Thermoanaerobaculia bacterium]
MRTNGALKVSLSAHPLLELPYGRYPRLLMAWLTTEAVRTREPVLQLGPSLSSFMSQLGIQITLNTDSDPIRVAVEPA